tara:strand:+ start:1205 stop:1465 length:261 start_codon:yes stop_codon:yes gene_type:complete
MDCTSAVAGLNAALNGCINDALNDIANNSLLSEQKVGQQVFYAMRGVLNQYADYGAADSEPQYMLCDEIERAFKKHLDVNISVSRW